MFISAMVGERSSKCPLPNGSISTPKKGIVNKEYFDGSAIPTPGIQLKEERPKLDILFID